MLTLIAAMALSGMEPPKMNVLVFSKTGGFRHDSIPAGQEALKDLAAKNDFSVEVTEDASVFRPYNMTKYHTVVFLNTTGDILNESQQNVLKTFVERGGGFVGVHAASDTEYGWPWYQELVGAWFASHPQIQEAEIINEDKAHPTMKMWPDRFKRTDEWYDFKANPRSNVNVLASLVPASYQNSKMPDDHPIVWSKEIGKGRSWYTGFGHTKETYAEPQFREMLLAAIRWTARAEP